MPKQFSWIDQRLVRDRHFEQMDVCAAALYLFLVTVADAQGMSWYGDTSIARRLSVDEPRVRNARGVLVRSGLLAFANGLYQVLALDAPSPAPMAVPPAVATCQSQGNANVNPNANVTPPPATPIMQAAPVAPAAAQIDRTVARHHLAAIHAVLERRP